MIDLEIHDGDVSPPQAAGAASRLPDLLRHVTVALCGHVRQLRQNGLPVPSEIEELAALLMYVATTRHAVPTTAGRPQAAHHVRMPDRLLLSKSEAAERLGVSVRTIERLVASGRLPQVHVERLARFRITDLEAYVNRLARAGSSKTA